MLYYSSIWNYNNPYDYAEVKIEQEYPGLFSKSQVQYHKELTCKYYDNLNKSILDHSGLNCSLPKDLPLLMHILRSPPHVQACQLWNHNTFWNNLTNEQTEPGPELIQQIELDYGSLENLKKSFISAAMSHFGSGWTDLVVHRYHAPALRWKSYMNQDTPMRHNYYPLLVIDVWEHAYARDYNSKAKYLEAIWSKIDWRVVTDRYTNRNKYIAEMGTYWL